MKLYMLMYFPCLDRNQHTANVGARCRWGCWKVKIFFGRHGGLFLGHSGWVEERVVEDVKRELKDLQQMNKPFLHWQAREYDVTWKERLLHVTDRDFGRAFMQR